MATPKKIEWIDEQQASSMLYMTPRYLRRSVKSGNLKGVIHYSQLHRCAVLYSKADIENYIYENSNLVA